MTSFRDRNPVRIGIASLIVLAALLGLVYKLRSLPFVTRTYRLSAEFADAAGLQTSNEVRVAGIKVGSVTKVELGRDRVIVSLAINRGVDIPSDATAEIALKTILGTKFVVIHATGAGKPLTDGGRIRLDHTSIPFEIYQAANSAVDLLTDVNGKQLNEAFKGLAEISADPKRNLAHTISGAASVLGTLGDRAGALGTLAEKGNEVLASLDAASPDIQKILSEGNVIVGVLARRRATVRALLSNTELLASQLAGLLRDKHPELDTILNDLHATLQVVDGSLAQLEEAVRILGPSTEAFARIAWRGRWASVCTYAAEATLLPLLPNINIGTGGSAGPPVDCALAGGGASVAVPTAATSGAPSRRLGGEAP